MNIKFSHVNLHLGRNQVVPLRDAYRVKVTCLEGSLWITQDHDQRDIILEPGESFTVYGKSPALVSAMVPSVLVVEEPAQLPQRGFLSGLTSLLGRWNGPARRREPKAFHHPAIELRCY